MARKFPKAFVAACALACTVSIAGAQDTLSDSVKRVQHAQKLNAVTVSAERVRFVNSIVGEVNQRRRAGSGYFADSLSIMRLPGLREAFNFPNIKTGGTPATWSIIMVGSNSLQDMPPPAATSSAKSGEKAGFSTFGRSAESSCSPVIWVNGAISDGDILHSLHKEDVAVIEVYSSISRVPVKYQTMSSNCGVVVLWLKQYFNP